MRLTHYHVNPNISIHGNGRVVAVAHQSIIQIKLKLNISNCIRNFLHGWNPGIILPRYVQIGRYDQGLLRVLGD